MKVIAKINENELLVQATADELSQLANWTSDWNRQNKGKRSWCVGSTLQVSEVYTFMQEIRKKRKELEELRQKLGDFANTLQFPEGLIIPEPKG